MPFDTTYYIYSRSTHTTEIRTEYAPGDQVRVFEFKEEPGFVYDPTRDDPIIDSLSNAFYPDLQTFTEQLQKQKQEQYPPYQASPAMALILIAVLIIITFFAIREREAEERESRPSAPLYPDEGGTTRVTRHRYDGAQLNLSGQYCHQSLIKHFPYYAGLNADDQVRFMNRLLKFIDNKIFTIYHDSPFIEMPLLVSATAIQLTFGLKKYLLPHFDHIHIYPQEFMWVEPVICFLEGNVSGHRINLSWKHFLEGLQSPTDGKNVGLHEIAHALHYQTFVVEQYADRHFRDNFDEFSGHGNKVYDAEMITEAGLYSEYAMTNFQEFWAESVELFFEKPAEVQRLYPSLYAAMSEVLNQDPLRLSA